MSAVHPALQRSPPPPPADGEAGLTFGPVPSRRLGRSLGVNPIPVRTCTYSCVYCQIGRTPCLRVDRRPFTPAHRVRRAVEDHLARSAGGGAGVDYLTLVSDGEPTLDVGLGRTLRELRGLGIPVAVITNGSLLHRPAVRRALARADWVSVKVDTVDERTWRRVNRPHGRLELDRVMEGLRAFARSCRGRLVTETMLVQGLNDTEIELERTAEFVATLAPHTAFLAVPTRPPAEAWVHPPGEETLVRAHALFQERLPRVELLLGYEGDAFPATGDPEADLLAITAVHPMRESAVRHLLREAGAGWDVVDGLLARGKLAEVPHGTVRYYLRPSGRPLPPGGSP